MYQAPQPDPESLPSARALLRSTTIALAVAAALLVGVVLPAEYGVDPTGVGQLLGLKRMGEIKVALALEAEADAAADAAALAAEEEAAANYVAVSEAATGSESTPVAGGKVAMTEITLQPDEGAEIKARMTEGGTIRYEWWTIGGVVNYDTHADRPDGTTHSYGRAVGQESDEGELTAAFDGLHGWFWRNRTQEAVTITLRIEGDFEELVEMP